VLWFSINGEGDDLYFKEVKKVFSGGYQGKYLRINLTNQTIEEEKIDSEWQRKFLGGRGLAARFYYAEIANHIEPFSSENKLILFTGPLTGTSGPATTKIGLATKSPETRQYLCSNGGGFFGPHLKKSGYDGLIIEGKATKPVYILIEDNQIKIEKGENLWGKTTKEVNKILKEKVGREDQVLSCGPAAENRVRLSGIQIGDRSFGRGGAGAVMASKNLKAIAVKGTGEIAVSEPNKFKEVVKEATAYVRKSKASHTEYGTAQYTAVMNELGCYPTRNFQTGVFEGINTISAEYMKKNFFIKNQACFHCPVACSQLCEVKEGPFKGAKSDPEYESIGTLGGVCGVSDFAAIIKANEICDELGIDTMSVGVIIGFAMELFERGYLTKKDTGGLELKFGNGMAMVKMIEKIANREDIGDLLAEGMLGIAEKMPEMQKYMMQVKGLPLAAYDPRGFFGNALTYGTSSRGACHNVGGWSIRDELLSGEYDRFAVKGKGKLIKSIQDVRGYIDSLGICTVVRSGYGFTDKPHGKVLEYLTGYDFTPELMTIGERIYNLERLIINREGRFRKDDLIPERFRTEKMPEGQAKGRVVSDEIYNTMLDEYYEVRGWDREGRPTKERLHKLNLDKI
jgi:aldehyde:ferredoxin oxidoreductase